MDKLVSTLVLTSVVVTLAIVLMTYYLGFVPLFMGYEELSFDYAYNTVKDGQAEISIHFKNTGSTELTVVALMINGEELKPKGHNPYPLELPTGSEARLRLHAGLDTFMSGITYEVAIITVSGGKYVKAITIP